MGWHPYCSYLRIRRRHPTAEVHLAVELSPTWIPTLLVRPNRSKGQLHLTPRRVKCGHTFDREQGQEQLGLATIYSNRWILNLCKQLLASIPMPKQTDLPISYNIASKSFWVSPRHGPVSRPALPDVVSNVNEIWIVRVHAITAGNGQRRIPPKPLVDDRTLRFQIKV